MKKIILHNYNSLIRMGEVELKEYIKRLEYYIYYQHGIITEAWKSLFNQELDDVIIREGKNDE